MKNIFVAFGLLGAIGLVSCDDSESDSESEDEKRSVCDCVNAEFDEDGKIKDKDLKEFCSDLEKEWKDKYKDASEDEKAEMMKEFEDCKQD